jgi:hypothetical protein
MGCEIDDLIGSMRELYFKSENFSRNCRGFAVD